MRFYLCLLLVAGGVLSGCRHNEPSTLAQPARAVQSVVAREQTVPIQEEVVGTVAAELRAVVSAKVSGAIEQMNAVPGQAVTAGFVIARLHALEITARRDQALAMRDDARQEFERVKQLLEQKIESQQKFDAVATRHRTAQGALDEANAMRTYTTLLAPFDGVIVRKRADQGDLATPGLPLVEIENPQRLRLEAEVPEAAANRIQLGNAYPVTIDAAQMHTNAPVSEIAPSANPFSRTVLIKLNLPRGPALHAGQFGRVTIPTGEKCALIVPASAVVTRGQLEFVFVVSGKTAVMRIVRSGRRAAGGVEILAGLTDGEHVVTDGAENLRDGQAIQEGTSGYRGEKQGK